MAFGEVVRSSVARVSPLAAVAHKTPALRLTNCVVCYHVALSCAAFFWARLARACVHRRASRCKRASRTSISSAPPQLGRNVLSSLLG